MDGPKAEQLFNLVAKAAFDQNHADVRLIDIPPELKDSLDALCQELDGLLLNYQIYGHGRLWVELSEEGLRKAQQICQNT